MLPKKDTPLKQIQKLTMPLTRLPGIGPKRASLMAQKGLRTILDLLFFTPIRYEDRSRITTIGIAEEGIPLLVKGKVVYGREERFYRGRKGLFKILIRDDENSLELLWFRYRKPYLISLADPKTELLAYGTIKSNRGIRQMIHPEINILNPNGLDISLGFYPVYSSITEISSNILRSTIKKALDQYLSDLIDPIPVKVVRALGLPALSEAIRYVHFPTGETSIERLNSCDTPYHRRLIFDRFFLVMLTLAFRKRHRERKTGQVYRVPPGLMEDLAEFFPYKLTADQMKAVEDMIHDFIQGKSMNRLLMGDVGCGKTVVAAVAAHIGVYNRNQVALMVPTQALANQHFESFSNLSQKMGFMPVLVTGHLKKSERQELHDKIRDGHYNLIIGTQSLIQESLSFPDLGMVIIDEQHKFGVRDRALMDRKGDNPHLLVMTATPIPRTLAITAYGDMDLSLIQGYPKGHMPVVTRLAAENQKRLVFDTLIQRLSEGQQAFVICPVIEGSEEVDLKNAVEMTIKLKKIVEPPFRVGLMHGRLPPEEREKVMSGFRKGLIHLLVGTTVIEVGIHVPRATVMIIEHPERFGLAQLHQLRGRVGRGSGEGICFLMMSRDLSEKAISRLKILADTHDGFIIAQKDLELRGHGELVGMRQTGIGELDFGEMIREPELLLNAKQEAQRLTGSDPELSHSDHRHLKAMIESLLARPLDI